MKKQFIVLAIMLLAAGSFAQGISGGLRAGLNLSNVKFEAEGISASPDAKTGFLAGAYLTAMFSEKLGLQPEAYFATGGYKMEGLGEQNMSFLTVPVLLRYNITPLINVHAGPQVGLVLKAESEDENGDTEDVKEFVKPTDFAAVLGAGVDLPFGLNGGVRYCLGLNNLDDSGTDGFTVKSKTFQVYLGYVLFGKKK